MAVSFHIVEPSLYSKLLLFYHQHFLPGLLPPDELGLGFHAPDPEHPSNRKVNERLLRRMEDKLSLCAVDETNGEMVGIRLCHSLTIEDAPVNIPSYEDHVNSGWPQRFAVMAFQEDSVLNVREVLEEYKETKLLRLNGLGVRMDYRKRGIASELHRRALINAAEKGFSIAAGVCTNYYTQKVYERQGFIKIKEICYPDFRINDGVVLKDVPAIHKSFISYAKKIDLNETQKELS